MSAPSIQLPEFTRKRLEDFQRLVRRIKLTEGVLAGLFGLAVSYIAVFVLDRFVDSSAAVRLLLLLGGSLGFGLYFPLKCHRWVWGTRKMEQVATLVKFRYPSLGDQLLGVVELAREDVAPGASETLARAAVSHVDDLVRDKDLSDAVPRPKQRSWGLAAAIPAALMVTALVAVPAAGRNAFYRWLMPWADVDRYTFAQVSALPESIVVPHGEEFAFTAELSETTQWSPDSGYVRFEDQAPVTSSLIDGRYKFSVPPQTDTGQLAVRIGDIRETLNVQVATRPELTSLTASIQLPDYLQYSRHLDIDVRGGVVSVLKGSLAGFVAEISRELDGATVQGLSAEVSDNRFVHDGVAVNESETLELQWKDSLGLSAKDAFRLKVKAVDDDVPAVSFQQLDSEPVVLTTDVISFDVQADDDFGLKEVGLEWRGIENPLRNPNPQNGDKVVTKGSPEMREFSSKATFCAVSDKVQPQSLELRAYAVDFKPDRGRTYSPTYVIHVLTPEEHAIWITNQLRRWASLADDVYEEEMRLFDANRELRRLAPDELNAPKNRQRIEQHAAAERANGQRLGDVTDHGEQLIRQAMRNKEMMVGHLETWADSLEALKEIAENRMPNVADLLAAAAKAPGKAKPPAETASSKPTSPTAGNNRSDQTGKGGSEAKPNENQSVGAPQLTDVEGGFNPSSKEDEDEEQSDSQGGKSRLSLPTTVLNGGPDQEGGPPPPAAEQVDDAVEEQADLLAEFARVREELQKIMDDLENSTFVKRLKAASRRQLEVAEDLNRTLFKGFGLNTASLDDRQKDQAEKIAEREEAQSRSVWMIQSDMEAYYDRRKMKKFLGILEEMEDLRVTTKLSGVSERVRQNLSGESIARAEFWSDTLDRWAEELVEPSPGGT